jgi:hypothetical protein
VKLRWLVPVILTASALLGWSGLTPQLLTGPLPPKASPAAGLPVIVRTDTMPKVLVVGQTYEITFTVTFPHDWNARTGDTVVYVNEYLLCIEGHPGAASATFTHACRFKPSTSGPVTIRLEGTESGLLLLVGASVLRSAHLDFNHTVIEVSPTAAHIAR